MNEITNYNSLNYPQNLLDRFWSKVNIPLDRNSDICWEWNAYRTPSGYGRFSINTGYPDQANRVTYMICYGTIPNDLFVCHDCDNPPCCNPYHLFLGTVLKNNQDSVQKGRNAKGTSHAHSVITEEIVDEFLKRTISGEFTSTSDVITEYGKHNLTREIIQRILHHGAWSHVTNKYSKTVLKQIADILSEMKPKLTENDVINIRQMIKHGYNNTYIANQYNVGPSAISSIKIGKTWKNVI